MSTITLSIRETRLVVERLLQAQGLPLGAVPAVRDYVLVAQAAGLDALTSLRDGLSQADRALGGAVLHRATGDGATEVDCRAQSAVVVAPALLDLALAGAPGERVELRVVDVNRPSLLAALAEQAPAHDAELTVAIDARGVTVTATRRPAHDADATRYAGIADTRLRRLVALTGSLPLARAVDAGLPVAEQLWWDLFHASNEALSEESLASLKHAGATPVTEQGEILPDLTDDDDFGDPQLPVTSGKDA
jgi:hypothetical protein